MVSSAAEKYTLVAAKLYGDDTSFYAYNLSRVMQYTEAGYWKLF